MNNEEQVMTDELVHGNNKTAMLTTIDNPYNPFTEFEQWLMYDTQNGYNTCGRIDRICETTEDMSENEKEIAINNAMDTIITNDFLAIYKKVFK